MGVSEAKRKKQNKKNENETKNIFGYVLDGIKECNGQDSFHYFGFEVDNTNIKFMGVYDGHGSKGKEASHFVNNAIKKLITDNKNNLKKWSMQANSREVITKMFVNGYKKIQQQMKKDQNFDLSGSCAISALLIDKVCYVINLGASRAVIGGKLIDSGPMRVYKLNDTNPGLAVARSLGDCYGHECGVGDEPQVSYRILEETDEFIVMGSDGIWDVMNSVEIVGYVFERLSDRNNRVERDRIAEEIVEECRKRWIIINKFKDTQVVERIKNDPNLDSNAKTSCIQQFVEQIEKQCSVDPNYQEEQNNTQPSAFQMINPEEKFTGKHNIDDISCVICFFH